MRIILERSKCISCGSCAAVCPDFWEMAEDGKSHLKGSKEDPKTGDEELEIDKDKKGCNQEAADICPVQIIHIVE